MPAFAAGVEQMGITHLDLPTAFWNEWVVALTAGQAHIPAGLTTVIIGGEAVYPEQLAQWQRQGRSDVRLFNTYGPNMDPDDGRVVSNLICQALRGNEMTVYGDGSQTRSFCYVSDMVAGLLALMEADFDGMEPVNLGNPNEMTVNALLEQVVAHTGTSASVVHRPLPVDDPRRRKPDITRAKNLLGWAPRHQLRDGLERTIDYFAGLPGGSA